MTHQAVSLETHDLPVSLPRQLAPMITSLNIKSKLTYQTQLKGRHYAACHTKSLRRVFDVPGALNASPAPPAHPWDLLNWTLARVDWCLTLQMNDSIQDAGHGMVAVLVACNQAGGQSSPARRSCFPDPDSIITRMGTNLVAPRLRPGAGYSAEDLGMVGAAHLDSFGDKVPPRELDAQTDGAVGCYKREGIAYISNVAVLPTARRQGIAKALVAAAEKQAAEWGCRAIGLHCNPKNKPALQLYQNLGYKLTSIQEPFYVPWFNGRGPDRCVFMIKRLRPAGQPQAVAA